MKNHGLKAIALAAAMFIGGLSTGLTHHSEAAFDAEKRITIEGTVTDVTWARPHILYFMDATMQGHDEMDEWVLEGPYPGALERAGWTRDSIRVGDKIVVTGNPARSGRPMMLVKEVVTAGGERIATE